MRTILLTNDDGWDSTGLATLRAAAAEVFPEARLCTVAPASEQSMCGHSLTTCVPLVSTKTGRDSWKVAGTPADCVRVALFALGIEPDLVLSGINHGGNLGQDVHVSGTCAAAREAVYHGRAAASFSQYLRRGLELDWDRTRQLCARALSQLVENGSSPVRGFWNFNFPHPDPDTDLEQLRIVPTHLESAPLPVAFETSAEGVHAYRGVYQDRARSAGSDVAVCFGGDVSMGWLDV